MVSPYDPRTLPVLLKYPITFQFGHFTLMMKCGFFFFWFNDQFERSIAQLTKPVKFEYLMLT